MKAMFEWLYKRLFPNPEIATKPFSIDTPAVKKFSFSFMPVDFKSPSLSLAPMPPLPLAPGFVSAERLPEARSIRADHSTGQPASRPSHPSVDLSTFLCHLVGSEVSGGFFADVQHAEAETTAIDRMNINLEQFDGMDDHNKTKLKLTIDFLVKKDSVLSEENIDVVEKILWAILKNQSGYHTLPCVSRAPNQLDPLKSSVMFGDHSKQDQDSGLIRIFEDFLLDPLHKVFAKAHRRCLEKKYPPAQLRM
jgi:hypothetical protein